MAVAIAAAVSGPSRGWVHWNATGISFRGGEAGRVEADKKGIGGERGKRRGRCGFEWDRPAPARSGATWRLVAAQFAPGSGPMRRPGPGREAHRLRSASSSINKRSMCSAVVWRTAARAVASVGRRRHLQSSHRPGADPARLLHVATPSSPSQREVNLCRCCLFRQAGGARDQG